MARFGRAISLKRNFSEMLIKNLQVTSLFTFYGFTEGGCLTVFPTKMFFI